MHPSGSASLLRSLKNATAAVRVTEIAPSARAYFLLKLLESTGAPRVWVVLFPSDEGIQDFLEDFESLKSLIAQDLAVEVLHYPQWSPSLFTSVTPSLKTRSQRAACLASLTEATLSDTHPQHRLIFTTLGESFR